MFRLLNNLFGGIFAFLGRLLRFGKKSEAPATESTKNAPAPEPAVKAASNRRDQSFFLEGDDARSFKAAGNSAAAAAKTPAAAPPASTPAQALNLPAPKVTSYADFPVTSDRRRPGANMKTFLDMARQLKTAR